MVLVVLIATKKLIIVLVMTHLVLSVQMAREDPCLRSLSMELQFMLVILQFIVFIRSRFLLLLKVVDFLALYIQVKRWLLLGR